MQPFNAGAVLSRSFSIWLKNLVPFTILTFLVYSPLILYTAVLLGGDLTLKQIETWDRVESLLGGVLNLIASAALAYGTLASGSLLPGIVMHLANNAITILLATDNLEPLAVVIAQHPELTGAMSIVMCATGFALFASPKEPGSS